MVDPTSNRQRRPLNHMLFMLAKNYADSAKVLEVRVQETKNPDPAPVIIMCLRGRAFRNTRNYPGP